MSIETEHGVISDAGRLHLLLQRAAEVGPIRFRRLLDHFGTAAAVLGASRSELQHVEGIGPKTAESIFAARGDDIEPEVERAAACGVRILCREDGDYPKPLLQIPDPPICLYVRGTMQPTDAVSIGIVGTRRCSSYGREQAVRFAQLLARAGCTVVSGMARGIDGAAHRAALEAGGRTLAVLGNGLAHVYPPEHQELAERIENAGALLSELPMDCAPDAKNFPARNRIIAGLSLGVLVVEAGKTSGALITARLAGEYNREVFAIPGRIDSPQLSAGVHELIRDGAKLVMCLEDILEEFAEVGDILRASPEAGGNEQSTGIGIVGMTPQEREVWQAVVEGAEDADAICSRVSISTGGVMSALTGLELKGLVRRMPGGRYERRQGTTTTEDGNR